MVIEAQSLLGPRQGPDRFRYYDVHASTDGSLYVYAYVEPEAEEDTGVMPIQRQGVNVLPVDSEPYVHYCFCSDQADDSSDITSESNC